MSSDSDDLYKSSLYQLMVGYSTLVVCVWMSHEVDFMSVNGVAMIVCWFLVMFDCNCFLYANVNSTVRWRKFCCLCSSDSS